MLIQFQFLAPQKFSSRLRVFKPTEAPTGNHALNPPCFLDTASEKQFILHNLPLPSGHSTTHFKATNFLCKGGARLKVLSSPHVQSEQSYHNGTEDAPVFWLFSCNFSKEQERSSLLPLAGSHSEVLMWRRHWMLPTPCSFFSPISNKMIFSKVKIKWRGEKKSIIS